MKEVSRGLFVVLLMKSLESFCSMIRLKVLSRVLVYSDCVVGCILDSSRKIVMMRLVLSVNIMSRESSWIV